MKNLIFILIIAGSMLFSNILHAQDTTAVKEKKFQEFKISAEIRPRLEYFHGYKQLAENDQKHGLSISQRTRLNMDFKNPNYIIRLSLQDVRTWGDQGLSVGNENFATSIHEAWGEAIVSPVFSIKLGRQEIAYDDQRILGAVDWGQQGRSHDAAIFKLKTEKFKGELAIAYNQDTVKYKGIDNVATSKKYKALQNLWMNYKFNDDMNLSFLFLNNGMQIATGGDAYSQTIRPRFTFDNKVFATHAAFYYQTGKEASLKKINAYYWWIDASYQFGKAFNLLAGYERLSGNSQSNITFENRAFSPMHGTAHKFNGHMDYFYSGNHAGSVGLDDIFLQLAFTLPKFSFGMHSHYFAAAANMQEPSTLRILEKFLGVELDIFCDFKLTKGVNVKTGYSQMIATDSMEYLKGGNNGATNNWAYLMVTFKPTLFDFKKEID